MRILCIDLGDKRTGMAISDELGITAQGIETYTRSGDEEQDIVYITRRANELGAGTILFGMPRNMNGTYGPQAEKVRAFAGVLQELWQGKVEYFDERMTTMVAERVLISADVSRKKRRQVVDKLAAVVILQGYLDTKANTR